jgi:hypothetical protein
VVDEAVRLIKPDDLAGAVDAPRLGTGDGEGIVDGGVSAAAIKETVFTGGGAGINPDDRKISVAIKLANTKPHYAGDALGAARIAPIGCISIPRVAHNALTLACKWESGQQNRHSHCRSSEPPSRVLRRRQQRLM